jgi:nucleotide-binding universal stress UspA family protein
VTACHVYGADIHRRRFSDMEPGLPEQYQQGETLTGLRTAHDRLIHEGFRTLSAEYIEDFAASAGRAGIAVESVAAEGRSYVGILHLARTRQCNLIVLGADGLGAVGNGMLGGTTSRVLQNAPCDVLVARRPPDTGPVLAGVDGSDEALKAVAKAVSLASAMKKPVHLAAAYDPDFHTRVFGVMAQSLSPEGQEQVGLAGQEKLHDSIINKGLGTLYADFLRQAEHRFSANGAAIKTFLVTGKAYRALDSQAGDSGADLVVVGRHGAHKQLGSRLGSNAEGLLRTTSANVLVVGEVDDMPGAAKLASAAAQSTLSAISMAWDSDAETRLKRVPSFVRSIAKRAVENAVRESGKHRVSAVDFDTVAARFGMGKRGADA